MAWGWRAPSADLSHRRNCAHFRYRTSRQWSWVLRGAANFPTSHANYLLNSTSKRRRNGRESEKADRDPRRLLSVAFVLEHRLYLLAQLRRVLVPVNGSGMMHRRLEHFFFRAGNLERAILFARVIPAIDGISLCGHKNWSVKQFYRAGK